jgi:hypothetical protein
MKVEKEVFLTKKRKKSKKTRKQESKEWRKNLHQSCPNQSPLLPKHHLLQEREVWLLIGWV